MNQNKELPRHHRILFYGTWLLLNLIQAYFTELQDDEAYYWVFAQYLDWGYFDHPPMTALMIRLGTFLPGELGVRLLAVLLNTATIFICEKLISKREPLLFYAICISLAVVQISGFMSVPDTPLMFFTALFFLAYRNFLRTFSWKNTLLLGLVAACMLFSKYHGVIILFFVLLSNLKLLRQPKVYVAGIMALVLFLPHLWWQYNHDWISFRYHLFESNVNKYKVSYTLEYIAGQILLAGPLAGVILLPAVFRYRTMNDLERALKFTAIGIFLFFFLSSFKGKVEANWTAPAIIPIIVLSHHYLLSRQGSRKWLMRLVPITMVLVIAARFLMVFDLVPGKAVAKRFHGWKEWPEELMQVTKGYPVVFNNSYQRASKHWFYTGQKTYSPNYYRERRNNYNFWPIEDSMLGRPVFILDIYNLDRMTDSLQGRLWKVGYRFDSSYNSFAKLMITTDKEKYSIRENDSLRMNLFLNVPPYQQAYLDAHPEVDPAVIAGLFRGQTWITDIPCGNLQTLQKLKSKTLTFLPKLEKGTYFMRFAIAADSDLYTHNSNKIKLEVE
jgi:hypothetical protein